MGDYSLLSTGFSIKVIGTGSKRDKTVEECDISENVITTVCKHDNQLFSLTSVTDQLVD